MYIFDVVVAVGFTFVRTQRVAENGGYLTLSTNKSRKNGTAFIHSRLRLRKRVYHLHVLTPL